MSPLDQIVYFLCFSKYNQVQQTVESINRMFGKAMRNQTGHGWKETHSIVIFMVGILSDPFLEFAYAICMRCLDGTEIERCYTLKTWLHRRFVSRLILGLYIYTSRMQNQGFSTSSWTESKPETNLQMYEPRMSLLTNLLRNQVFSVLMLMLLEPHHWVFT